MTEVGKWKKPALVVETARRVRIDAQGVAGNRNPGPKPGLFSVVDLRRSLRFSGTPAFSVPFTNNF